MPAAHPAPAPGSAPRGRPVGRKTQPQPTAEQTPAACPHCGSTRHHVIRPLPTQRHSGYHQQRPYTSIERRRCRCADCGRAFIRVERPYDPSQWFGPLPPSDAYCPPAA